MIARLKSLGAALALCGSLILAGPAVAQSAAASETTPAVAQDAATSGTIQAVVSSTADGVRVRYRLPAPVRTFVFADRDTIRTLWSVATPGLVLADGAVTGEAPFDAFELHLKPDAAEVDRVYPGLSRIGQGRVIYGPGLKGETGTTVLAFDLAPGEASLPSTNSIDSYVYLGPSSGIATDPRGDMVTGDTVPADLAASLNRAFFRSIAFYQMRLGADLAFRPALLVSTDSAVTNFRGDVTNRGVISVRFQGEAWREAAEIVTTFVWHETFHLWNSGDEITRDGEAAPWLHEGAANHAALVGAVSSGDLTEDQGRAVLTREIKGCRFSLADRNLRQGALTSGNAVYDCGALIQWIADLELRRAGMGDFFSLWKELLDKARSSPDGYGVTEFRAALVPDSAATLLLDGPGATRWAALRTRLAALGVRIENRPGGADLRAAALFHVAKRNCRSGSYGFYDNPDGLKLDGADCGVLSGEPVIDTIEGLNPQADGRALFDAVQARCAASLPVRYLTRDGRTLEAVCDTPLAEPEIWAVAEAPPLALPDRAAPSA